jgi:hypothetical protein
MMKRDLLVFTAFLHFPAFEPEKNDKRSKMPFLIFFKKRAANNLINLIIFVVFIAFLSNSIKLHKNYKRVPKLVTYIV